MIVITLNIADYDVRHILIDNGSSTDVLFYDASSKMSILGDRLGHVNSPFVGFTGDAVPMEGIITLSVVAGRYPKNPRLKSIFWL